MMISTDTAMRIAMLRRRGARTRALQPGHRARIPIPIVTGSSVTMKSLAAVGPRGRRSGGPPSPVPAPRRSTPRLIHRGIVAKQSTLESEVRVIERARFARAR
jgi:hypothetical protein